MSHKVSVMDFGSEKISVFVGERGLNDTIRALAMGTSEYSGYIDGEVLEPLKLKEAMETAVCNAQDVLGQKIDSLYIGVPGDFCVTVCKTLSLNFKKKHKITKYDIQDLYDSCTDFENEQDYEIIDVSPIYFMLDSERKLMDPEGQVSTSLSAVVSYILVEKRFTEPVSEILKGAGIKQVAFTSSALAQVLYLFPSQKRDEGVILADVGYINTEVVVAKGDGILSMKTFSQGGGNITADFATCLEIPFKQAEKLKRKLRLSASYSNDDVCYYEEDGQLKTSQSKTLNTVATERVKIIAKGIDKCLSLCEHEFPNYTPCSITGGGISFIRGAKEIVSIQIGRDTEIVVPTAPQAERPNLSTPWALMALALDEQFGKRTVLDKIFKKII